MSEWKKEEPVGKDGLHIGCLTCSTACLVAPMTMILNVGFGYSALTKDGEYVWQEGYDRDNESMTIEEAEALAVVDSDHDWRIVRDGPLHGETFQRHGKNKWVCIESNQGFA